MIISVSRRTDIPAFYSDWFFNRLKAGYVLVRNPMNYRQVGKVSLDPSVVDCLVFWTKDPSKLLERLDLLADYNYYFQITITGYGSKIERYLSPQEKIVAATQELAQVIGRERVIWRYDPIILNSLLDLEYHQQQFTRLAKELAASTNKCVISFVDLYKKTQRNMGSIQVRMGETAMYQVAEALSLIAKDHGLVLETCSEQIDLTTLDIKHGKCIDDDLISALSGRRLVAKKDPNQRSECGCVTSIDIGVYNTCPHGCLYCYANFSDKAVANSVAQHDPKSAFLIGELEADDVIKEREMQSFFTDQLSLF